MIDRKKLCIGNFINTPQGIGIIKELRKNRAFIEFKSEKSLIPFPYKDLSGIPLEIHELEKVGINLVEDKIENDCVKNLPLGKDAFIIYRHLDYYLLLERDWRKEPSWMLGIVYTDCPNPEDNFITNHFLFEIKFLHELQNLPWKLGNDVF
jgi:hypothetical protein